MRVRDLSLARKQAQNAQNADNITNELGNNIGMSIFGIDEESFSRTIFFNTNDNDLKSTAAINSKLNNFKLFAMFFVLNKTRLEYIYFRLLILRR